MKKPNILIIVADQQRYDCIGYSNSYPVKTPYIDELAAQGMWFSNAYTPIPVCCPARQAFLNGRRPETFGALWNYNIALEIPALSPGEYAWTKDIKALEYQGTFIGKWSANPIYNPLYYGFDNYIGLEEYYNFRKAKYPHVAYKGGWMGEVDPVPHQDNVTHWLARQAIYQIEKYASGGQPWHIRLDFTGPHLPCRPSRKFAAMYKPENVPEWGSFRDEFHNKPYIQKQQLYNWGVEDYTWQDWAQTVALYYAMISEIDHAIGEVLKKLDELNLAENTLVIYTADHGDLCGGHRMVDKHYVLYDDVVKVPLVIRWPGVIKPGSVCQEFVCHFLDLPPTILEILGQQPPEFFHGTSMLKLLKGERPTGWRKEVVSTYNGQQFGLYTQRMIRDNQWKYIWNTTDVDELYDLQKDPYELNNLIYAQGYAPLLSKMRRKLYQTLLREGDGLVRSEWMKRQLLENRKI